MDRCACSEDLREAYRIASQAADRLRAGICEALVIDPDTHEGDLDLLARLYALRG